MTEKLFWEDPYRKEFTATLVNQFAAKSGHVVELDRTCFYATSGGQPHDRGKLNGAEVYNVTAEGDHILHHVAAPIEGPSVQGAIDWNRRFDHMQQHTGQHILSAAFFRLFQAETSSFHLGEQYCSIELSKRDLKEQQTREAEDIANGVVTSATPVDSFQVDPEKAKQFPLRKQSDLQEALRIVQIGEFDFSPCSGTHVKNAGEVGMIVIYGFEKLSLTLKVNFLCGNRVRRRYQQDLAVLKTLSKDLTTSFELLPESVSKLQAQVKELRKELGQLKEDSLRAEALEILTHETNPIIAVWKRPYQSVRFLAQRLSTIAQTFGALASTTERRVVFFKNATLDFDLKKVFAEFLSRTGAKGGGAPHFLEAGGVAEIDNLEELLRALPW